MRKAVVASIAVLVLAPVLPGAAKPRPAGTYSIAGFDPVAGDLGVAVQSRYLAVGVGAPFAKANVGAIAIQCFQNASYGPRGLELLEKGLSPKEVVDELIRADPERDLRQVGVVDAHGRSFSYTGKNCPEWRGGRFGPNYVVQGDIVVGEAVVVSLEKAFVNTGGSLADRLLAALDAAEAAGGDRRGKQSAALLVVRKNGGVSGFSDRFIDIRVDDNPDSVRELKRIYALWERQFLALSRLRTAEDFARAGNVEAARLERERARAPFEQDLRANPNDVDALETIAWVLTETGLDLDRAVELAERAIKLAPGEDDYRATLAEAYFRKGNIAKAIEIETELVQKNPGDTDYAKSPDRFKAAQKP
ncbi:MAG: DUF1028 domain-containing protein [Acidobacteriia bacterium]|nr:DUF1028 domain-containing protein [Terriglobia bacterium]